MRILKCTMTDYIKTKKKLLVFLALIPLICIVRMADSDAATFLFTMVYCLFASIVVAGFPYYYDKMEEIGFMQMLPAKPGERIFGHYLYSFLAVTAGYGMAVLCEVLSGLVHPAGKAFLLTEGLSGADAFGKVSFLVVGIALVFAGFQNFLFTIFRFNSMQVVNLIRIIPAFIFFFGFNALGAGEGDVSEAADLLRYFYSHSIWVFVVCVGIFLVFAFASSMLEKRRV